MPWNVVMKERGNIGIATVHISVVSAVLWKRYSCRRATVICMDAWSDTGDYGTSVMAKGECV